MIVTRQIFNDFIIVELLSLGFGAGVVIFLFSSSSSVRRIHSSIIPSFLVHHIKLILAVVIAGTSFAFTSG